MYKDDFFARKEFMLSSQNDSHHLHSRPSPMGRLHGSDSCLFVVGLRAGARPGEGTRTEWWTASPELEWWTSASRWPSAGASFAGERVLGGGSGLQVRMSAQPWWASVSPCWFCTIYYEVYLCIWEIQRLDLTVVKVYAVTDWRSCMLGWPRCRIFQNK